MGLFSYNQIYIDQTLSARTRMECSWPAIIKFFTFKVENIVFADIFVFLHTKKMTVLPYNHLCFQVQVLEALNQF